MVHGDGGATGTGAGFQLKFISANMEGRERVGARDRRSFELRMAAGMGRGSGTRKN